MPKADALTNAIPKMAAIFAAIFLMSCMSSTLDDRLREADAMLTLGEPKRSAKILVQSAKLYPEDPRRPEILIKAARIYDTFLGDLDNAVGVSSLVIDEYPMSKAALIAREHRFGLYKEARQFDNAAEDVSFLIKNDSENAERHRLSLASLYLENRDYDQSRVELMNLIRDKKTSESTLEQSAFFYSESLFLEGQTETAAKWLAAFIREFPKSSYVPEAKLHLATCLEESGKLGAAMNVLSSAKAYPNKDVISIRMKSMEDRGSPQNKSERPKAAVSRKKPR